MFFKKKGLPKVGELVICTITKILPHAAFVRLDEYERIDAMLHVSEISSRWVRNIKEHVSEGTKVVCKVLHIDHEKGHVDVSLKRVTNSEKTRKLNEEKIGKKVEKLIEVTAKKIKEDPQKSLRTVGSSLIEYFSSLSDFYELTKKEGVDIIDETELDSKWKKELKSAIQEQLDAIKVKMQKSFELRSFESDGVNRIKKLFKDLEEFSLKKGIKVEFSYVSSPQYMLTFTAKSYKEGEAILKELTDALEKHASKNKIEATLLE